MCFEGQATEFADRLDMVCETKSTKASNCGVYVVRERQEERSGN